MKNGIRKALLTDESRENEQALAAVDILERFTAEDLEYFVMKKLYATTGIPYDYLKTSGPLWALKTEKKLEMLRQHAGSQRVDNWLLGYCRSLNKFAPINFDIMPMDQFLVFAEIFNPDVYGEIRAILSFENENQSQEHSVAEYGQPDAIKHPVLTDITKTIDAVNEKGIVLEVQKPKRAVYHTIIHITPEKRITCSSDMQKITEKHDEWFDYTIATRKSDKYENLVKRYPIEVQAFEEILAGERPYYVRTDEPDYTTPFLKTYEFTETTYCHLNEWGREIYHALKEELSKKVSNSHRFRPTGLLKTDFEEMRKSPNYSAELEGMHKKEVVCVAEFINLEKTLLDCYVLSCEDAHVSTESAWDNSEATVKELIVELDSEFNINYLKKIPFDKVKLYGTIEYKLSEEGSELGLQVDALSLMF